MLEVSLRAKPPVTANGPISAAALAVLALLLVVSLVQFVDRSAGSTNRPHTPVPTTSQVTTPP